jgi:hypothetical protein
MDEDDLFRLDLAGYHKDFICDALTEFLEGAPKYGRVLIEIRTSRMMLDRLEIENGPGSAFFKGVLVKVCNTGFDETIEVVLGPPPRQH